MKSAERSVKVAAGVLFAGGRVLLCRRAASARYALQWEFPGGKVEIGETPSEAIAREIREELGVEASIGALLWHEETSYPDGGIFAVSFYLITEWAGDIVNQVFDTVEWTQPDGLAERYEILQGNLKFCNELPRLLRENGVSDQ